MTQIQPLDFILLSILCLKGPQHTTVLRETCDSPSIGPVNAALRRLEEQGIARWGLAGYKWIVTPHGSQLFKNRATALKIYQVQ